MSATAPSSPFPTARRDLRRSTRIAQAVPLVVSGQDSFGQPFQERTSAVTLNCHGCRYPSRHGSRTGSLVTLHIPSFEAGGRPRTVRGMVKSVRYPGSPRELYQVGVELEAPANVWGINPPPADWLQFSAETPSVAEATSQAASVPGNGQASTAAAEEKADTQSSSSSGPPSTTVPNATSTDAARGNRVAVPPARVLQALQEKIRQAAEKEVQSSAASYLRQAVSQAVQTIEKASEAGARQLEKCGAQQLENLAASLREQLVARLETEFDQARQRWQEPLEIQRSRAEETIGRLERSVIEAQRGLATAQGILEKAARDLESQIPTKVRQAVEQATAEFTSEAARITDRQIVRLAEKAQGVTGEAAAQVDARVADARSQLQSAASATLAEFQRRAGVELELAVADAREGVTSSLASLTATQRAENEARQQAWQIELGRFSEQTAEQFRQRLGGILNAWIVAAVGAVNQQSKAVLESLTQQTPEDLQAPEPTTSS